MPQFLQRHPCHVQPMALVHSTTSLQVSTVDTWCTAQWLTEWRFPNLTCYQSLGWHEPPDPNSGRDASNALLPSSASGQGQQPSNALFQYSVQVCSTTYTWRSARASASQTNSRCATQAASSRSASLMADGNQLGSAAAAGRVATEASNSAVRLFHTLHMCK